MEDVYLMIQEKRWHDLFSLIKHNQTCIKTNRSEWGSIFRIIEKEFLASIEREKRAIVLKLCEEYIRLDTFGYINCSSGGMVKVEDIALSIINDNEPARLLFFAKMCRFSKKAKSILVEMEENYGVEKSNCFNHSKASEHRLKRVDWLQPLFRSSLEAEFYQALENVFPTYFIYPNVAFSNIFDFKKISPSLSKEERAYFLKSVVDFVVYDPVDSHSPKYFFEVDSFYHDSDKAKHRDGLKNSIFAAANINLIRFRPSDDLRGDRSLFENELRKTIAALSAQNCN